MTLTLIPDLGDLFRLQPQFNAGTIVEILRGLGARQVLWASSDDPDHPLRDALPAAGTVIQELNLPNWAWAQAELDKLSEYLSQYPQGRERLRDAGQADRVFAEVLTSPLSAQQIFSAEVMGACETYYATLRERLDEGPGTLWRARRLKEWASLLQGQTGLVIVPLDDIPDLLRLLPAAQLPDLSHFEPGETSRLRALADRASQLDKHDELEALLAALSREMGDAVTPKAELDAAAASIYLAVGELNAARELLERAVHQLNDDLPRSIAGLTLARLGQVRDVLGERELALRTYRAVLALHYIPAIARQTAEAGLLTPFQLADTEPEQ